MLETNEVFKRLDREFYNKNAIDLSKDLLGKYLVHVVKGKKLSGKITEVEAYMGVQDKASHAYNNKRTSRTEPMYGIPGHSYVYLIYGMYYCFNVVAAEEGNPQAVLIRSIEPEENLELMAELRYGKTYNSLNNYQLKNFGNGPGKLCKALSITKEQNTLDLCSSNLYIEDRGDTVEQIIADKRINIDYAEEAKDYLWRFYIHK